MTRHREVRVCPICIHRNPPHLNECENCLEDLRSVVVRSVQVAAWPPLRRTFGIPERAVLGFCAGAALGLLFRPSAPFGGQLPVHSVFELTVGGASGLDSLLVPLAQRSFGLMMVVGIIGSLIAAASVKFAWAGAGDWGKPRRRCPYCAESIQPAAIICRYCNRPV